MGEYRGQVGGVSACGGRRGEEVAKEGRHEGTTVDEILGVGLAVFWDSGFSHSIVGLTTTEAFYFSPNEAGFVNGTCS